MTRRCGFDSRPGLHTVAGSSNGKTADSVSAFTLNVVAKVKSLHTLYSGPEGRFGRTVLVI